MSEKEIRLILRDVIADLDRRAIRALGKVLLPSMLGASLALGARAARLGRGKDAHVDPPEDQDHQNENSPGAL